MAVIKAGNGAGQQYWNCTDCMLVFSPITTLVWESPLGYTTHLCQRQRLEASRPSFISHLLHARQNVEVVVTWTETPVSSEYSEGFMAWAECI